MLSIKTVVGMSENVDTKDIIRSMLHELDLSPEQMDYFENQPLMQPTTVSAPKFKSRLSFIPTKRNLISLMDLSKVSDIMLLAMDANEPFDSYGAALLSAFMAQGIPSVIGVIVGLDGLSPKHRSEAKKAVTKAFQHKFTTEPRIIALETSSDAQNLVRFLSVGYAREFWRNQRSYMLPLSFEFSNHAPDNEFGTLRLTGHVRGEPLDVNNLIHLTGIGDYQIEKVEHLSDPYAYDKRGSPAYNAELQLLEPLPVSKPSSSTSFANSTNGGADHDMMVEDGGSSAPQIQWEPTPELQETLVTLTEPDISNTEQTWPTEEELNYAEQVKSKKKLRVPKGMSAYQAKWLVYSDDELEEEEEEEEEYEVERVPGQNVEMKGTNGTESEVEEEEELEEEMEEIDDEETALIKKLEHDAEQRKLNESQKKIKRTNPDLEVADDEEEDDFNFPDEVQVPDGQLAQDAFKEYRGLRSFRTSPWDPYENLPVEYGTIFQFPSFESTRKKILKANQLASKQFIPNGTFVCIHLKDAHISTYQQIKELVSQHEPVIASSLLMFENKFSVMHYAVTKSLHYDHVIKTGEDVIFHVGFRRFTGAPLFTEDTRGANKFKMEKFLHPAKGCIATVYAPITFPHQPVLLWKVDSGGIPALAASGTVRTCDPKRVIVKRIILTGHPLSVEKGRVVVSGMFHHPSDVKYYMKAELTTKNNVRGQIREPLGTKGLFKCYFGDRITNADVVCLSLYKRVYPNWLVLPQPPRPEGTITVAPAIPASSETHNVEMH